MNSDPNICRSILRCGICTYPNCIYIHPPELIRSIPPVDYPILPVPQIYSYYPPSPQMQQYIPYPPSPQIPIQNPNINQQSSQQVNQQTSSNIHFQRLLSGTLPKLTAKKHK